MSEPAVWGGARPGLAWLQSADGASQGRSVTRDSETPGLTLIHHTRGHLVFRFFLSKKFTRNHQDGKRLRYIKLHSDLTFPEQHLSCMCLFNLTFFSWTFVFLVSVFQNPSCDHCSLSVPDQIFVLATSYLLLLWLSLLHEPIFSTHILISNLCECWYLSIMLIYPPFLCWNISWKGSYHYWDYLLLDNDFVRTWYTYFLWCNIINDKSPMYQNQNNWHWKYFTFVLWCFHSILFLFVSCKRDVDRLFYQMWFVKLSLSKWHNLIFFRRKFSLCFPWHYFIVFVNNIIENAQILKIYIPVMSDQFWTTF